MGLLLDMDQLQKFFTNDKSFSSSTAKKRLVVLRSALYEYFRSRQSPDDASVHNFLSTLLLQLVKLKSDNDFNKKSTRIAMILILLQPGMIQSNDSGVRSQLYHYCRDWMSEMQHASGNSQSGKIDKLIIVATVLRFIARIYQSSHGAEDHELDFMRVYLPDILHKLEYPTYEKKFFLGVTKAKAEYKTQLRYWVYIFSSLIRLQFPISHNFYDHLFIALNSEYTPLARHAALLFKQEVDRGGECMQMVVVEWLRRVPADSAQAEVHTYRNSDYGSNHEALTPGIWRLDDPLVRSHVLSALQDLSNHMSLAAVDLEDGATSSHKTHSNRTINTTMTMDVYIDIYEYVIKQCEEYIHDAKCCSDVIKALHDHQYAWTLKRELSERDRELYDKWTASLKTLVGQCEMSDVQFPVLLRACESLGKFFARKSYQTPPDHSTSLNTYSDESGDYNYLLALFDILVKRISLLIDQYGANGVNIRSNVGSSRAEVQPHRLSESLCALMWFCPSDEISNTASISGITAPLWSKLSSLLKHAIPLIGEALSLDICQRLRDRIFLLMLGTEDLQSMAMQPTSPASSRASSPVPSSPALSSPATMRTSYSDRANFIYNPIMLSTLLSTYEMVLVRYTSSRTAGVIKGLWNELTSIVNQGRASHDFAKVIYSVSDLMTDSLLTMVDPHGLDISFTEYWKSLPHLDDNVIGRGLGKNSDIVYDKQALAQLQSHGVYLLTHFALMWFPQINSGDDDIVKSNTEIESERTVFSGEYVYPRPARLARIIQVLVARVHEYDDCLQYYNIEALQKIVLRMNIDRMFVQCQPATTAPSYFIQCTAIALTCLERDRNTYSQDERFWNFLSKVQAFYKRPETSASPSEWADELHVELDELVEEYSLFDSVFEDPRQRHSKVLRMHMMAEKKKQEKERMKAEHEADQDKLLLQYRTYVDPSLSREQGREQEVSINTIEHETDSNDGNDDDQNQQQQMNSGLSSQPNSRPPSRPASVAFSSDSNVMTTIQEYSMHQSLINSYHATTSNGNHEDIVELSVDTSHDHQDSGSDSASEHSSSSEEDSPNKLNVRKVTNAGRGGYDGEEVSLLNHSSNRDIVTSSGLSLQLPQTPIVNTTKSMGNVIPTSNGFGQAIQQAYSDSNSLSRSTPNAPSHDGNKLYTPAQQRRAWTPLEFERVILSKWFALCVHGDDSSHTGDSTVDSHSEAVTPPMMMRFLGHSKELLKSRGIDVNTIKSIWTLVDRAKRGSIARGQFITFMRLLSLKYEGRDPNIEQYYATASDPTISLPPLETVPTVSTEDSSSRNSTNSNNGKNIIISEGYIEPPSPVTPNTNHNPIAVALSSMNNDQDTTHDKDGNHAAKINEDILLEGSDASAEVLVESPSIKNPLESAMNLQVELQAAANTNGGNNVDTSNSNSSEGMQSKDPIKSGTHLWIPSVEERAALSHWYGVIHRAAKEGGPLPDDQEVKQRMVRFLFKSGLPKDTLKHIYQLVLGQQVKVEKVKFATLVRLVTLAMNDVEPTIANYKKYATTHYEWPEFAARRNDEHHDHTSEK